MECGNVENVDKSKLSIKIKNKNEINNYFDELYNYIIESSDLYNKDTYTKKLSDITRAKNIILRYYPDSVDYYNKPLDEIFLYEKAIKEILYCKMKSHVNKNFSQILPEYTNLDNSTNKYFFITLRPKFIDETKNIRMAFKQFINNIFKTCMWDWAFGCWEINEIGEFKSLHTHIIATLDKGNERAKKNGGKLSIIREIKRIFNNNDNYKKIMILDDPGIDVQINKGINNIIPRIKYMKGEKKESGKGPDIEATRLWRLDKRIAPIYYCKEDNIPSDIMDLI